jgi:hypothetical protein
VYHFQLRQFPHLARAFNLTREELDTNVLVPWAAGQAVRWNDRSWSPEKARLTVYEGPELATEEIGLGRGWANATRAGQDVTERLLAEADRPSAREEALARLKAEIERRAASGEVRLAAVMDIATELHPDWRASDRLALAEQAVWELLHVRAVELFMADLAVDRERWQPILLAWDTWAGGEPAHWLRRIE